MTTAHQIESIRAAALKIIDQRAIPRGRLKQRLVDRGFNEGEVERVLESLERVGVLDDHAFARDVAGRMLQKELIARDALRVRLLRKGVGEEAVDSVLDEVYDGRDESSDVEQAAIRILARMSNRLTPEVVARRLAAALARRGFEDELCLATAERFASAQTDPTTG